MIERKVFLLALAALSLGTVACSKSRPPPKYKGPKLALKMKYLPGSYLLEGKTSMEQEVTAGEEELPKETLSQDVVLELEVSQPDAAGQKKMTLTFRRFKQMVKMGAKMTSFDSALLADAQDPKLAQMVAPLLKAKWVVIVGPDGQIKNVSGSDALWDVLVPSDLVSAQVLAEMKAKMGDAMFKDLVGKGTEMLLPNKPVGPGDTWEAKMDFAIPFLGTVELAYQCELDDVEETAEGRIAVISFSGQTKAKDSLLTGTLTGMRMKLKKAHVKQTGTIRFNVDTGMIVGQDMVQAGDFGISMKFPDGPSEDMAAKQTLRVRSTKKRKTPASGPR